MLRLREGAVELAGIPVGRADLARDDAVVRAMLSPPWRAVLDGYVPEPFRHLG